MLLNNRGFIFLEVLISFSLLMIVLTTIIPLTVLIEKERKVLSDRRLHASLLHDELQYYLWNPSTSSKTINDLKIDFTEEGNKIKGCMTWKNVKKNTDKICLYGLSNT